MDRREVRKKHLRVAKELLDGWSDKIPQFLENGKFKVRTDWFKAINLQVLLAKEEGVIDSKTAFGLTARIDEVDLSQDHRITREEVDIGNKILEDFITQLEQE